MLFSNCRVSKLWDISSHYFSIFLQNVLSVSALIWYVKCFIGLRKCSDCGTLHHLPKSFWGPRRPQDPQPKIKGNTMIVTLSKYAPHPLHHNSSFAQKQKNGEKHTSASRAVCLGSNIGCSMSKMLGNQMYTGNKWNYGNIWKAGSFFT